MKYNIFILRMNKYGLDYWIFMVLQIVFRTSDNHMLIVQETTVSV